MNVTRITTSPLQTQAEAVVVGVFADRPVGGLAAEVDRATGGLISRLIETKEYSAKRWDLLPLYNVPGAKAPLVLVVGFDEAAKFDCGAAFTAAGAAAKRLAGKQRGKVAFHLADNWSSQMIEAGLAGAMAGAEGQDIYRAEKKQRPFEELLWAGGDEASVKNGQILGEAVSLTRRLINEPAEVVYPESFAGRAAEVAKDCGLECEIWDEKKLEAERCGSLLAVNRGSSRPARLVILRHKGGKPGVAPLALVGKGVTFDSGGLSLKTPEQMKTMKCDMSGAATVLGAMQAVARLKLPVNVVGLAGLVENMTGGRAMKLGDVLHARSGKTIEVLNTDAEGRLVLADVLNVTLDEKPARIIDLATLTGACIVALGDHVAGLMANDQPWCDTLIAAAKSCGEPVWQLPMFPEYSDMIKSEVADIKNIGKGRSGGAITAAKFLEEFVGGVPWVHMDIAGPAFFDEVKPWSDGGATGTYVRTLVEVARGQAG